MPAKSPFSGGGEWRRCRRCQSILPLTDYHPDARRPQGRETRCKRCVAARRAEAKLISTHLAEVAERWSDNTTTPAPDDHEYGLPFPVWLEAQRTNSTP